jgi:hypothetical protein
MGGAESPGRRGSPGRYLPGLTAAALGLCAAGWLVLTPFAFGYRGRAQDAAVTNLATGGGLALVCLATLVAATVAWRRALRADGVLATAPPDRARVRRRMPRAAAARPAPAPDQLLTALRELLAPVLVPAAERPPAPAEPALAEPAPAEPAPAELAPAELAPAELAPAELAEAAGPTGDGPAAAAPAGPARRPAPAELVLATAGAVIPEPRNAAERRGGIAAIESMLARAELRMPGYEDEETW